MALLTPVQVKIVGSDLTPTAADAAGETFKPGDHRLIVHNGDASSHTITVAVPGDTKYGQDQPDVTYTVAAGAWAGIGPFPADLADPTDGLVHVTYDAATAMERVLVR